MIPSPTIPFVEYKGSGFPTTYPIAFPTFEEADVVLEVKNNLGVDIATPFYILSGFGIPNQFAKLDFTVPLPLNYQVKISFTTQAHQPAKLRDLGRFAPEAMEKSLDRVVMSTLAISHKIDLANLDIINLGVDITALEAADAVHDSRLDDMDTLNLLQDAELTEHEGRIVALEAVASSAPTVSLKSANFNAAYNFIYVISGTVSALLPAPVTNANIQFKLNGGGPVTLLRNGSEKIDFVASDKVLSSVDQSTSLVSDGTDWFII